MYAGSFFLYNNVVNDIFLTFTEIAFLWLSIKILIGFTYDLNQHSSTYKNLFIIFHTHTHIYIYWWYFFSAPVIVPMDIGENGRLQLNVMWMSWKWLILINQLIKPLSGSNQGFDHILSSFVFRFFVYDIRLGHNDDVNSLLMIFLHSALIALFIVFYWQQFPSIRSLFIKT